MYERGGREDARRETQQPGTSAALVGFIERTGQDLLLNAARVARRRLPSALHVEDVKFVVFLVYTHELFLPTISASVLSTTCSGMSGQCCPFFSLPSISELF